MSEPQWFLFLLFHLLGHCLWFWSPPVRLAAFHVIIPPISVMGLGYPPGTQGEKERWLTGLKFFNGLMGHQVSVARYWACRTCCSLYFIRCSGHNFTRFPGTCWSAIDARVHCLHLVKIPTRQQVDANERRYVAVLFLLCNGVLHVLSKRIMAPETGGLVLFAIKTRRKKFKF